jgi:hypothetical protein
MTSFLDLACPVRRARYSRVRGSQARRTSTIRHNTLFACRSPPRLIP